MTTGTAARCAWSFAAILAGALAAAPHAALAQTSPGAPGTPQTIPEKVDPPLQSGRSESLSDRLDATNGVVKPKPGVDPGIVKPAPVPEPNSTPVIPPPPGNGAK